RLRVRAVEDVKRHVQLLVIGKARKAAHVAVKDGAGDPADALADVHLDVAVADGVDDKRRPVEGGDLDGAVLAGDANSRNHELRHAVVDRDDVVDGRIGKQ